MSRGTCLVLRLACWLERRLNCSVCVAWGDQGFRQGSVAA